MTSSGATGVAAGVSVPVRCAHPNDPPNEEGAEMDDQKGQVEEFVKEWAAAEQRGDAPAFPHRQVRMG